MPVLTPANVNAPESLAQLRALAPDLMVVVAYGQRLGREVLELPRHGCINLHASLLPRHRGAAPIAWAIASGDTVTGVTTIKMTERLDAGDILGQREVAISPSDTTPTLQERLAPAGAALLLETLQAVRAGTVAPRRQDETRASFAPKLKKADGRIDWGMPAEWIWRRVRAFQPWPGCVSELPAGSGRQVKVLQARVESGQGRPGVIRDTGGEGPAVQTGDGLLRLLEVQPEGRRPMSGRAFVSGYRLRPGDRAD